MRHSLDVRASHGFAHNAAHRPGAPGQEFEMDSSPLVSSSDSESSSSSSSSEEAEPMDYDQ
eukprot:scaffold62777_cov17-Tisochrysis_lutea.AAC.1